MRKLLNFLPILLNIWMMELGVMNQIWILYFLILVKRVHNIMNQNLKYKIISQLGPDRHFLPLVTTLEILMIQEKPDPISKEQVLRSLVMNICFLKFVINDNFRS